jgi:AbiV family abortive infection protein
MGNKKFDKPPLTREQLGQGHRECLQNAKRLIEDAQLLGRHERYRAGYLVLLLASEELGKAIWLRIGQSVEAHKWREWWRSYFSHADKQAAGILAWAQANDWEEYERNWHEIHKRIDKAAARVAVLREKIMYVNFDEGKFISPLEDNEIKKDFNEELKFSEWLLKWLS